MDNPASGKSLSAYLPPLTNATMREAAQGLRLLLGSYPAGKPSDPEVYGSAVTALLGKYPADVIAAVTDPLAGYPSRHKFLPSIAELKQELEKEAWRIHYEPVMRRLEAERRATEAEENKPVDAATRKRVGEMMLELKRKLSA